MTIGQSVEASLGGGGDRGRNLRQRPSAQCGLQVALSIFSGPGGTKAECYVIYGKCNLVDIRLIMVSLLIIRRVSL